MQIRKVKFLARNLGHIPYPSSPCLFSLPSFLSLPFFLIQPRGLPPLLFEPDAGARKPWRIWPGREKVGFEAADSWWTLDDIYNRIQFVTESTSALPHCHCGVPPWSTFRPSSTYSFCKNCIPCHAWKVPFRIRVMRFPLRFLGKKKITEMNRVCPTGSWSEAVLICRKYANPR